MAFYRYEFLLFSDFAVHEVLISEGVREEAFNKLKGIDYLIIEALRHKKHYSHICLSEAIDIAQRLNVKKAWFTHISHEMGKASDVNPTLPNNMMLAYDGLEIHI